MKGQFKALQITTLFAGIDVSDFDSEGLKSGRTLIGLPEGVGCGTDY